LVDVVEDQHGAWVADSALAALSRVASWYATRNDDYAVPFVKGMRRVPAQARKRSRILDDDELRAVWHAAEAAGVYGAFICTALTTAQRRAVLVRMRWDSISPEGVWTIRQESGREKGTAGSLQLPAAAMRIINALPRYASNPFVFAGTKPGQPLAGFSERHVAFMAKAGVTGFTIHDLRRSARSLMSRAGVSSEHAERVNRHPLIASEIIERHKRSYPRFWQWRTDTAQNALLARHMESVFGWPLHITTSPNQRTLYNFPMQSGGADMLRLATMRLHVTPHRGAVVAPRMARTRHCCRAHGRGSGPDQQRPAWAVDRSRRRPHAAS
jgi:hypothetical protein